jgi:hypothetical protein
MLPIERGALDSLCGIYGIVKAERMINDTTTEGSQELFNEIIWFLDYKKLLGQILTRGMFLRLIKMIFSEVIKDRIPYQEIRFTGTSSPDLNTFWTEIASFMEEKPKRAVLLGVGGVHDHWSLINSITDNQIQLCCFSYLNQLDRANCTIDYVCNKGKHILFPDQTYFLGRE